MLKNITTTDLIGAIRVILAELDAINQTGEDDAATEDAVRRLSRLLAEYQGRGASINKLF